MALVCEERDSDASEPARSGVPPGSTTDLGVPTNLRAFREGDTTPLASRTAVSRVDNNEDGLPKVSSTEKDRCSMREEGSVLVSGATPLHRPFALGSDCESSLTQTNLGKNQASIAVINDLERETEHSTARVNGNRSLPMSLKRKMPAAANAPEDAPVKRPRDSMPLSREHGNKVPPTLLLATAKDSLVLSPLHAFVRQQIEVFTSTEADIIQPSPGRKNPVTLHQIGLRCIHCRDVPHKQRIKRAVCYPSSVGRVYHSVSDMKHDHFKACPSLPADVRLRFLELKEQKKSNTDKKLSSRTTGCSSSTAQYYFDTASEMGMVDGKGGVFWKDSKQNGLPTPQLDTRTQESSTSSKLVNLTHGPSPLLRQGPNVLAQLSACQRLSLPLHLAAALRHHQGFFQRSLQQQHLLSILAKQDGTINACSPNRSSPPGPCPSASDTLPKAISTMSVSCPTDPHYLNPIHCFVRRHLEYFVAGKEEVSAPSPGRKLKAVLGQVGIRCIHCARLSPKDRVKRSICYPPSIGGIYHAVSNIKCDHFALCRGLPPAERQEFLRLRSTGTRKLPKQPKSAADQGFANSTNQYYHDCALRMGLYDTKQGIRFSSVENPDLRSTAGEALASDASSTATSPPDGISALMIAASDLVASSTAPTSPLGENYRSSKEE